MCSITLVLLLPVTDEYLEDAQVSIFRYEWNELNNLALSYHGDYSKIQLHVLRKMNDECKCAKCLLNNNL